MSSNKTPKIPRAGALLAKCPDSYAGIAEKTESYKSRVCDWIHGRSQPSREQKQKMFEAYGIPVEAWDTPAEWAEETKEGEVSEAPEVHTQPKKASQPPHLACPSPADHAPQASPTYDRERNIARLHKIISEGLDELETSDLPANKRAETLKKLADAQVALDKSTGENAITEVKIAAHPAFKRAIKVVTGALKAHPKALDDTIAALEKWQSEAGASQVKGSDA